jgi:hypothetical protein
MSNRITYLNGTKYTGTVTTLTENEIDQNSLAELSQVAPEGIPDIWGAALYFSWMLKATMPPRSKAGKDEDSFEKRILGSNDLFIDLLRGVFCGLIEIERVSLGFIDAGKEGAKALTALERIVSVNPLRHNETLTLFNYRPEPCGNEAQKTITVAVGYPESIFFPSADFSDWPMPSVEGTPEDNMRKMILAHYQDPNIEALFIRFLNKLLEANKHQPQNVAWSYAIGQYLNRHKVVQAPDGDYVKNTIGCGQIELLMGERKDGNPIIEEVSLVRLKPLALDKAEFKDGKLVLSETESISLEDCGIVPASDGDKAIIFDLPDREILLQGRFRWTKAKAGAGIIVSFGGQEKYIAGEWIRPEDVFVDQVLTFEAESSKKGSGKSAAKAENIGPDFPDIPVKERFLHLVDGCKVVRNAKESVTYFVKIKGISDKQKALSTRKYEKGKGLKIIESGVFSPNLMLWPDFCHENWKSYYAHFYGFGADGDQYFVKMISRSGQKVTLRSPGTEYSDSPFERAILLRQSDGGSPVEFGVYNLKPKSDLPRERLQGTVNVGIDFGTSNTSVAWQLPGDDAVASFKFRSQCRPIFCDVEHYLQYRFFPFLSAQATIIPSELFIPGTVSGDRDSWQAGPARYVIPIMGRECEDAFKSKKNLKWNPDHLYLKAYFHQLFLMLFCEIFKNGIGSVGLGLSYPNSFTKSKFRSYYSDILQVLDFVKMRTDMSISGMKILSEAEAGANVARTSEMKKVVIDMGGGTTDIALLDEDNQVLCCDSVNFAGAFLADMAAKRLAIKSEEGRWGFDHMIRFGRGSEIENIQKAGPDIGDHFEMVADIVRRFLAAKWRPQYDFKSPLDMGQQLAIYPLGQAWGFLGMKNDLDKKAIMGKYFQNFILQNVPHPKEILAQSILKSSQAFEPRDTIDRKITEGHVSRRSIMGANFLSRNATKKVAFRDLSWADGIDYVLPPGKFDEGDHLVVEIRATEWRKSLLIETEENILNKILNKLEVGKIATIPNINSELDNMLTSIDSGRIGRRADNTLVLKASPFLLVIEILKLFMPELVKS